jgi:hypothetical protein
MKSVREVPGELRQLVWFRPDGRLDLERDAEQIILCALYLGTMDEIRLLFGLYGRALIRETVSRDRSGNRMLPDSVFALWQLAFDIEDSELRIRCADNEAI